MINLCTCLTLLSIFLSSSIFAQSSSLPDNLISAQKSELRFMRFPQDQGPSHRMVRSISQDDEGFMWFGTSYGLMQFDGYNFVEFLHDPDDPTSISDNKIYGILKDRSGTLWFGTQKGLNKLDHQTHTFLRYKHDLSDSQTISDNWITSIIEDNDGMLWIGTRLGGLNKFDPSSGIFKHYRYEQNNPNSVGGDHVNTIYLDSLGELWLGTSTGGLNKYDRDKDQFIRYNNNPGDETSLSSNNITVIYEDSNANLWIGTEEAGLNKYNKETDSFSRFIHAPDNSESISNNKIESIIDGVDNKLWIGTGKGLNEFDYENNTFKRYGHDPKDMFSIIEEYIYSLYVDKSGLLWIGTASGLTKLNPYQQDFLKYVHNENIKNSLSTNNIWSIFENDSGILWVGTSNGLNKIDRKTGTNIIFLHDPEDDSTLSSNAIDALYEDSSGILWVGTEYGLNRFDYKTGNIKRFYSDPNDSNTLSDYRILRINENRKGELWIGTLNGGFNIYDKDKGTFTRFMNDPSNEKSLIGNSVTSILETKKGEIWIGTSGGLDRFDRSTGEFTHFLHKSEDPGSISNNNITSLTEDSRGYLWLTTRLGGLNKFDPESGKSINYSEFEGLISSIVYAVFEDRSGKIWISSNKGLSVLYPESEEIRNFSSSGEYLDMRFNINAYFKNSQDEMLFGGTNGLYVFSIADIITTPTKPAIVLTACKFDNFPENSIDNLNDMDELTIAYNNNSFTLEFSVLDFINSSKNSYLGMLEGYDDDWIDLKKHNFKSYMNLPFGDYIFKVVGENADGIVSANEASIKIIITPPFWLTTWFKILFTIMIIGMIALSHKIRVKWKLKSLLDQKNHLEKEVEDRTYELKKSHEQLEDKVVERTKELKESEESFRSTFENAPIGVVLVGLNKKYLDVNQSMCDIVGYSKEELLEMTFNDLTHPDDTAENNEKVEEILKGDLNNFHLDKRYIHKEGHDVSIHLNASIVRDDEGNPRHFIGQILDFTKRKEAEAEKKKLEEQYFHAQKMQSVGRLAGGIAHDFNNILAGIMGYGEILKMKFSDTSTMEGKASATIFEGAERAAQLTKQLLEFSRKEESITQPVDINKVIKSATQMLEKIFEEKILVVQEFEEDINLVEADEGQMDQIFTNLIINAKDAMPDGGELRLTTKNIFLNEQDVKTMPDINVGDYVLISITDTGTGMTADIKSRIFEPFFTTKVASKGTGLGLSTVYALIKKHNGFINLYSELGKGTTFLVYLPVSDKEQIVEEAAEDLVRGKGTVLIVDDEESIRNLTKTQLESLGYSIVTANNGIEAIKIYEKLPEIKIVILDMIMPELDGSDTFFRLKEINLEVKVIISSGFSKQGKVQKILDSGACGFIQKPFNIRELSTVISEALTN